MPDLRLERELSGRIAGVDEVGRGPWAGPVIAAAVVLPSVVPITLSRDLDDSKRLAPRTREHLFDLLSQYAEISLGASSTREIERYNILGATHRAMRRALMGFTKPPDIALIDGSSLPEALDCNARSVIGGDGISLSIAAASIVAKVTRDRIMVALAQRYPGFGWETNAGYGTPQHRIGLASFGVTPHHRRTFAPIARLLKENAC